MTSSPALWQLVPAAATLPWARLGAWPTPLTAASGAMAGRLWFKREDLASPRYGGNKVRTLEVVLGMAAAAGAQRIWATGAYGSNHTLATALHGGAAGLAVGALLFPQPPSEPARANLAALATTGVPIEPLGGIAALPLAMARLRRRAPGDVVMPPGAATPVGAVGALSAGIELAMQVAAGAAPPIDQIIVPAGSTCTSAGLLAGVQLAAACGIGPARPPTVIGVRVTPWPVTARSRIAWLAHATLRRLEALVGLPARIELPALWRGLQLDGRFQGLGYGHPSAVGLAAAATLAAAGAPPLDDVYASKAGAALLARRDAGVTVLWATKSSAPLPQPSVADLARLPPALQRWLAR